MTTRHTPRESYWRGHWAAIDGSAIATPNDDAAAFARGAERGAAALAEAMRCKTYRERWAWISMYVVRLSQNDDATPALLPDAGGPWAIATASLVGATKEANR